MLGRRRLSVGDQSIPVVTFTLNLEDAEGKPVLVETALRRDTVQREESLPGGAIVSMFRVSLATVLISFGCCVVLVVWMMHRETLRERQRREEEHLAFAGVMANGIVHDFRNPMSSLRLDVQMLEKEAGRAAGLRPDRVATLASRSRHTIDRMDKVFEEFFYLARPGGDEAERIDLAACLRDCLAMLAPRLEQARVTANTAIPDTAVNIQAPPASIRRALTNVINNAIQFSNPADALDVTLKADGAQAIVNVIDRGPGVPKAERKRIFDMFVSTRPGGTGLGLFLARTALARCGGTLELIDPPDGGSCFRITLPLAA